MTKFQLSNIKRANLPYIAAEVESMINQAPGAPEPPPPAAPRHVSRLEILDAQIKACAFCSAQTMNPTMCDTCITKNERKTA